MGAPKILGNCIVHDCDRPATGRDYCGIHYQLWYRHGKPEAPSYEDRKRRRFFNHLYMDPNSGCWIWDGFRNLKGYGVIMIGGRKHVASRASWEIHNGPIPEGLFVCHKCDFPPCVNPDHLFLGTCEENFQDMRQKKRHPFGERGGRAKLSESDVIAIRADERPHFAIAKEYDVTQTLIRAIKVRKIWRHLDGEIVPSKSSRKLTPEQVIEIRPASGTNKEIGQRYGITGEMVGHIKRLKAYRDVAA